MKTLMNTPPKDWTLELYKQTATSSGYSIELVSHTEEIYVEIHEGKLEVSPKYTPPHFRFTLDNGFSWICCYNFDNLPDAIKVAWNNLVKTGDIQ